MIVQNFGIFLNTEERGMLKNVVLEYYYTITVDMQRRPVQNRFVRSYLDCATLSFKQSYPVLE